MKVTYKFLSILLLSALPVLANSQDLEECALLEDSQSSSLSWSEHSLTRIVASWLRGVPHPTETPRKAYDYITDIEDLEECALNEDDSNKRPDLGWSEYLEDAHKQAKMHTIEGARRMCSYVKEGERLLGLDSIAFLDSLGLVSLETLEYLLTKFFFFDANFVNSRIYKFIEEAKEDASSVGAYIIISTGIMVVYVAILTYLQHRAENLYRAPAAAVIAGAEIADIHQQLAALAGGGGALQGNNAFVNLPQAEPPIFQLVRERVQEIVRAHHARQMLAGPEDVMGGWNER